MKAEANGTCARAFAVQCKQPISGRRCDVIRPNNEYDAVQETLRKKTVAQKSVPLFVLIATEEAKSEKKFWAADGLHVF